MTLPAYPRRAPDPSARRAPRRPRAPVSPVPVHPRLRRAGHPRRRRVARRRAGVLMASRDASEPPVASSLEQLLAAKEIMLSCGSGGVGKTTTAAAAGAMAAVHLGGKVLVVTVDPARRLANALGLERFGNVEKQVPPEAFEAAGVEPRGELWAAMLDTKESWDELVRRHAPDGETREAILTNPLYQNITGKFIQSHDYIAMERLYEIHSSGRYDLIIVDTPPTRNAIDFLEAPERMADFFSSRLLRWLIAPYRSRLITAASKPFYSVADRILGSQFLEDIAEFFILFQTMYDGFVERAEAVTRTLEDKRTTFVVVSTLESAPVREAEFFIDALSEKEFHLGAVVLNKVLPSYFVDPDAARTAQQFVSGAPDLAGKLPAELGSSEDVARVLREVGEKLPRLPGGGHPRGRAAEGAGPRPRHRGHGALLRPRHLRPGRAPRPRPAHLDLRPAAGPRHPNRSTSRLWTDAPMRPFVSWSVLWARPVPSVENHVAASRPIHSPCGGRKRWTVRSGLMNRYSAKGRAALIPLPKSAAAAARWSGVGSSPATTGTSSRIQSVVGPASSHDPATTRCSVA
ncbi:MAG: ArsA-related P-loop ATPase [Acidimicrobiia bacterium]|nr:ArsA-related P-loop ATPase [Acidimicrobiia bacterium]